MLRASLKLLLLARSAAGMAASWGLAPKPTTKISEGAAVTGRAVFFMPSVLPVCDKEPMTCSEFALSFTFGLSLAEGSKVHYVPRGISPHLVVHVER